MPKLIINKLLESWFWGVSLLHSVYVVYLAFIYRYSLLCGKGVGVYAVLSFFLLLLICFAFLFFFPNRRRLLFGWRKIAILIFVLLNLLMFGFLVIYGVCFSCVDECVNGYLKNRS